MSGKNDVLNRTWTLIPDPDNCDDDMAAVEDVDMPENSSVYVDATLNHKPYMNNTTTPVQLKHFSTNNNQTYTNSEESPTTKTNLSSNNQNTFSLAKSPYILIKSMIIEYEKVSIERNNVEMLFQSMHDQHYDSLFDEANMALINTDPLPFSRPSSPTTSETNLEIPVTCKLASEDISLFKIPSPISLSGSSSIENLDKLALSYGPKAFNAQTVPNSFDVFISDLQKSSSSKHLERNDSPLESLNLNLQHQSSSQAMGSKNGTGKILTSSVEKDLNEEKQQYYNQFIKPKTQRTFFKSIDMEETSEAGFFKTSSPFKRHIVVGQGNTGSSSNSVLNRTIDIDKGGSVESLNSRTSSVESFAKMHGFAAGDDEDRPRSVLNTTYTSWSTDKNTPELDTSIENHQTKEENKTVIFNKTQDFNNNLHESVNNNSGSKEINQIRPSSNNNNNNKNKVDMNRTYEKEEMEVDLEEVDTDYYNSTQLLEPNPSRVMNMTKNLTSTTTAATPTVKSSIPKPSLPATSRLSSIFPKSKPLPKASGISATQPVASAIINPVTTIIPKPVVSSTANNLLATKVVPQTAKKSNPVPNNINAVPNAIPSIQRISRFGIPTSTVPITANSNIKSPSQPNSNEVKPLPVANSLILPVPTTVANQNPSVINPSRLSSSSTASSASSSSVMSSKENKDTAGNTVNNTVSGQAKSSPSNYGFMSKLKPPGQSGIPSITKIVSSSKLNQVSTSSGNINSTSAAPVVTKLPAGVQILKKQTSQTSVIMRNATNSQIKVADFID